MFKGEASGSRVQALRCPGPRTQLKLQCRSPACLLTQTDFQADYLVDAFPEVDLFSMGR